MRKKDDVMKKVMRVQ